MLPWAEFGLPTNSTVGLDFGPIIPSKDNVGCGYFHTLISKTINSKVIRLKIYRHIKKFIIKMSFDIFNIFVIFLNFSLCLIIISKFWLLIVILSKYKVNKNNNGKYISFYFSSIYSTFQQFLELVLVIFRG